MNQGKTQFDKITFDASDLSRAGYDAFMKSGNIFAKGFEEIIRQSMALAQSSAEKQGQLMKAALSSKTLNEWTEIQSKIAQASFDDFMAGATKISEMSVKLLSESAEPLNQQMTKSMSKGMKKAAA